MKKSTIGKGPPRYDIHAIPWHGGITIHPAGLACITWASSAHGPDLAILASHGPQRCGPHLRVPRYAHHTKRQNASNFGRQKKPLCQLHRQAAGLHHRTRPCLSKSLCPHLPIPHGGLGSLQAPLDATRLWVWTRIDLQWSHTPVVARPRQQANAESTTQYRDTVLVSAQSSTGGSDTGRYKSTMGYKSAAGYSTPDTVLQGTQRSRGK